MIEILNRVRQSYVKQYRIDKLAIEAGHKVLRLPPYHPELNPIENVWSQVKGYVAARNRDFKLTTVKTLMEEGVAQVTPENWKNYVQNVIKIEENMWKADNLIEVTHDRLIINLDSDDSDDEISSSESDHDLDLGVSPLQH